VKKNEEKSGVIKTTVADFNLYKKECEKWIRKLNISGWYIDYEWRDMSDDEGYDAFCKYLLEDRNITLGLAKEISKERYSKGYIRRLAFHEVGELLLTRLSAYGGARFISEHMTNEARHEVIHNLERALFK
jgi:hypothetical protein